MNQTQMRIFVFCLFSLILTLLLITKFNENRLMNDIRDASPESYENVYFYRDSIRDGKGLNLEITGTAKDEFTTLLKGARKSNISLKSTQYTDEVKIVFTLKGKKTRKVEIHGILTEEYPDELILSVSIVRGNGYFNGGQYLSAELLSWLREITEEEAYQEVWIE